jgi:AraC family transcriptional regulator
MALRQTTKEDYRQRLAQAQRFLESKLDDEVRPSEVARAANFSLHHFHRIFRAQLGESVMEHVRRLRLERAARELRTTTAPRLLDVGLRAGYQSHEAFTRAFVDRFAMPPSEFRAHGSARVEAFVRSFPRPPNTSPVELREVPSFRIAALRHVGSYAAVQDTWRALLARRPSTERLFGVCPDDPEVTEVDHLRFDAGYETREGVEVLAPLTEVRVPAGTWAIQVHTGPYETLVDTYLSLIGHWIPSSGYELAADAVVEHYLNDPAVTASGELKTELRVRLT